MEKMIVGAVGLADPTLFLGTWGRFEDVSVIRHHILVLLVDKRGTQERGGATQTRVYGAGRVPACRRRVGVGVAGRRRIADPSRVCGHRFTAPRRRFGGRCVSGLFLRSACDGGGFPRHAKLLLDIDPGPTSLGKGNP